MSIFLTILAVIGKILLGIVLVMLALLLIVLFTPIRFRFDACLSRLDLDQTGEELQQIMIRTNAQTDETEVANGVLAGLRDKLQVNAFVHWILYLVRARFTFPKPQVSVKLLFFTLYPGKEKAKKKKSDNKEKEKNQKNTQESETAEPPASEEQKDASVRINASEQEVQKNSSEQEQKEGSDTKKEKDEINPVAESKPSRGIRIVKTSRQEAEKERFSILGFFNFLWKVFGFLIGLINKPYAVFQKFLYTISGIRDKISLVRDLLETDAYERGKQVLFKQIKRLLKGLAPRKCNVRLYYGAGDPCLTADILAVYSMLHPLFRGHVQVEADFNHCVLEGEVHLKGRLTLFRILFCLARVYFNKDLRLVLKRLKSIKDMD